MIDPLGAAAARRIPYVASRAEPLRDGFILFEDNKRLILTGKRIDVSVLPRWNAARAIAALSTEDGTIAMLPDEADQGVASFNVPIAITRAWPSGDFVYVMTVTDGGIAREYCRGPFTIVSGAAFEPARLDADSATALIARRSEALARKLQLFADGAPVLIAGSLVLTIRPAPGYPTALATWSTASGKIVIDSAASGLISLAVARTEMGALPAGNWCGVLSPGGDSAEVLPALWRGPVIIKE